MFPTRATVALALTAVALVLLVSFRTPADVVQPSGGDTAVVSSDAGTRVRATEPPATNGAGGDPASGTGGTSNGTSNGASSGSNGGGTSGSTGTSGTKTVDGPTVDTRYGPVQVEITVSGSQITNVVALQLPDGDRHSAQISSRVQDMLASQALQAQSASIDGVSGATYTSEAYAQSLQAALDAAGI